MKTEQLASAPALDQFDAVLFLTWSDWTTERRSNRYHYATRFARHIPVIFLQNQRLVGKDFQAANAGLAGIDLINVSAPISPRQTESILELLRHRGIKCPLLWIYDSLHYERLISALPRSLRVYHATEDYFTPSSAMSTSAVITESVRRLTAEIDLVVAVTEPVLAELRSNCGYRGPAVVAENGCDFEFFAELDDSANCTQAEGERAPVVIYQGALNARLDYELLHALAVLLPEYEFRFAGPCLESVGLSRLRKRENVRLLGPMNPKDFAGEMLRASVGIIPFVQDEWIRNSLPLKTFEYIACGLPVVSVPIDPLARHAVHSGVLRFARSAAEFAEAITRMSSLRDDPALLCQRRELARENSYDSRFTTVAAELNALSRRARGSTVPLNVALLFDPASCHVGTVSEHIRAFRRYSAHDFTFVPATNVSGATSTIETFGSIDFSLFDVVIVHYSIRVSLPHHLVENFAIALESFHGLKVLFIQDEYEAVECARTWMDRLGFDLVYTCVPLEQREAVYPAYRFPATDFLPTLTGYVPEAAGIDRFVTSLAERSKAIAYRGRRLPEIYGQLGHEKYVIGTEVKRLSEAMGLPVDISCEAEARIYGDAWYEFLGSARATLGTESGSNVFDFDGSLSQQIARIKERNPKVSFTEVWNTVLREHDGKIRMNQVSPKIFEAIRLHTALILFEGDYSGVVEPNRHYIALKKDFSNFEEVVRKLQNDDLIHSMTERAYSEVIVSGRYSYRAFVECVDEDLRARCLRRVPRRPMYGAVYVVSDAGVVSPCLPAIPLGLAGAADVLDGKESFQGIQQKLLQSLADKSDPGAGSPTESAAQRAESRAAVLRMGKQLLLRYGAPSLRRVHAAVAQQPMANRLARIVYSKVPLSVRSRIWKIVKGG
ncbi:MAG: putative teichuronic acid biosynthesis glycosyltransferase TuaH [Candidatus Accumulibacter adjunctus]|uniref:Teichuronic acid biosynthesis glycosyltransferase TuaH n=1 Tax=Candidatus Accumulibacter adjunctus TaxID=1454001 RepID=A0A011MI47_9PROT|nr:MAG: putative teichuronic acid biosynthesis glycosyltransferase TuaH [Candidatus Accumulibacter adjunctus]